jgi:hypothetical protein
MWRSRSKTAWSSARRRRASTCIPADPSADAQLGAFGDLVGGELITVRARVGTADTDAGQDLLLALMDDEDPAVHRAGDQRRPDIGRVCSGHRRQGSERVHAVPRLRRRGRAARLSCGRLSRSRARADGDDDSHPDLARHRMLVAVRRPRRAAVPAAGQRPVRRVRDPRALGRGRVARRASHRAEARRPGRLTRLHVRPGEARTQGRRDPRDQHIRDTPPRSPDDRVVPQAARRDAAPVLPLRAARRPHVRHRKPRRRCWSRTP